MKVLIYSRVSTDEQAEKYGLDAQRHALRGLATRRGYTITEEVAEEGISGTIADRPGLARVRDLLRSGQADGVLIYDLSRLARETVLSLTLLAELHTLGTVEFLARPSEDTPDGKMLNTIEAAFAERERSKLIERTKAGRLAKMRRGLVPCGPYPFGYRPEQPGKGAPYTQPGGLVIVEDEAKLVRQLYAWAEEGISVRQMATRLGASGAKAPRGGPWSKPTITKLLRNPVYKGTFILGRLTSDKKQAAWVRVERPEAEWIRITVAPIVSTVTWERGQACFERNRSRLVGRPDKREYLLRGLLVCGVCGKRYVGGASRGRRVYRCSGRDSLLGEHRCLGSRELGADKVEQEVKAAITDMLNNPRRLLGAEQYQARQGARHGEAEEVARALPDCRARRARLLDLAVDGTVSKAVFADRDAPLAAAGAAGRRARQGGRWERRSGRPGARR